MFWEAEKDTEAAVNGRIRSTASRQCDIESFNLSSLVLGLIYKRKIAMLLLTRCQNFKCLAND